MKWINIAFLETVAIRQLNVCRSFFESENFQCYDSNIAFVLFGIQARPWEWINISKCFTSWNPFPSISISLFSCQCFSQKYSSAIFSSAWLCQHYWLCPSSVRPCRNYLFWTYCTDFFQILVVASLEPYTETFFFWIFEKKNSGGIFYEYFSFSLTWDPMRAKISKRSPYKSQPKVFKLLLNFLPNSPHKITLGLLKIEMLKIFVLFSLTWDPIGAKISKWYSSYKLQPKLLKLLLIFPPIGPRKTSFGIFKILNFGFLAFFLRKFQIHHCSPWRNWNLNYLENEWL